MGVADDVIAPAFPLDRRSGKAGQQVPGRVTEDAEILRLA